jgi:uncharacterized protein (DUF1800 family)
MTPKIPTTAAIRFGYGFAPGITPPQDAGAMLGLLAGPDVMAQRFAITKFAVRAEEERALGALRRARRKGQAGAQAALKEANRVAVGKQAADLRRSMLRPMLSEDGLRERLVRFWADHFSVTAQGKGLRFVTTAYIEDAIRPNITGSFGRLLRMAVTHPVMMVYLDQIQSIGPNSSIGKRAGRGLNENLAREVLELHTLGVGSSYSQSDVRQFAELLTGLFYNFRTGFNFRAQAAEPGAEEVLGKSYGGGRAKLADIYAALDDLALHPDTARHISRKLAVHFVADTPDAALVDFMTAAYRASDGDLMAVYGAMLEHPAAWEGFGAKAKQPFDYLVSALRALGVGADELEGMGLRQTRLGLSAPMAVMGQDWQAAPGPDGWPETIGNWITPQGLAARIQWALVAAGQYGSRLDPKEFARQTLGEVADGILIRSVGLSESRIEGVALVLASPEFNRR